MSSHSQLALILVAIVACGPSAKDRRRLDSAYAATRAATVATQAGEVTPAPETATMHFDGARTAFLARDAAGTARELRGAAAVNRREASTVSRATRSSLIASADELERLARRLDRRGVTGVKTVKDLDRAFARADLAGATVHASRARDDWTNAMIGDAAENFTAYADACDDAVRRAGLSASPEARKAIDGARSLGARLARGESVVPADAEASLKSMNRWIQELAVAVARSPR